MINTKDMINISKLLTILILSISILIPINSYSNTKYNYLLTIPCIDINTRQITTVGIQTISVEESQLWLTFVLGNTSRETLVEYIQANDKSVPIPQLRKFLDYVNYACSPVVKKLIDNGGKGYHVEQIGPSA